MAAFIKFEGVDGEATDAQHVKWSNLASLAQEMEVPSGGGRGGGRRRGDVVVADLVCTKELDAASAKIAESMLTGKVYPRVKVDVTTASADSRQTYYQYELVNVLVTSYQVNVDGAHPGPPAELFALDCESMKVIYKQFNPDGSLGDSHEYTWSRSRP